jgi:hypothetical protein
MDLEDLALIRRGQPATLPLQSGPNHNPFLDPEGRRLRTGRLVASRDDD